MTAVGLLGKSLYLGLVVVDLPQRPCRGNYRGSRLVGQIAEELITNRGRSDPVSSLCRLFCCR